MLVQRGVRNWDVINIGTDAPRAMWGPRGEICEPDRRLGPGQPNHQQWDCLMSVNPAGIEPAGKDRPECPAGVPTYLIRMIVTPAMSGTNPAGAHAPGP